MNTNRKTAKKRQNYKSDVKTKNMDSVIKQEPRKDSKSKRVNYDNTRLARIDKIVAKAMNDIVWYSKNAELLKAAGSVPFASILGARILADMSQTVPGIMSFGWSPAIGTDETGYPYAINQAGKSMYSYLVHANSRNYKYEYQDLVMMVVAGAQVFAALSCPIRAYGFAKTYAEQTLYTPDAMLMAMGFDPTDFRNNLGQIWFDINEMISRTTQIWIPNTLPFIQRWFWMNANVYKDANDPKGQSYLYVQNSFWKLDETASENGTALTPVQLESDGMFTFDPTRKTYKWAEWKEMINTMIDALINSEDRGVMFGDILNAYGADKIYALPQIPADFRLEPVYNPEVLTQIENLTVTAMQQVGMLQTTAGIKPIWANPNNGTLGSQANNFAYQWGAPKSALINFHHAEQPQPAEIMIATRVTTVGAFVQTQQSTWSCTADQTVTIKEDDTCIIPRACGTEIINTARIWERNGTVPQSGASWFTNRRVYFNSQNTWTGGGAFDLMSFDWHPFVYSMTGDFKLLTPAAGQSWETVNGVNGDFANYSVIDYTTIRKLHDTALFSEFGVPQM